MKNVITCFMILIAKHNIIQNLTYFTPNEFFDSKISICCFFIDIWNYWNVAQIHFCCQFLGIIAAEGYSYRRRNYFPQEFWEINNTDSKLKRIRIYLCFFHRDGKASLKLFWPDFCIFFITGHLQQVLQSKEKLVIWLFIY